MAAGLIPLPSRDGLDAGTVHNNRLGVVHVRG
jgi:hypothetical protein